MLATEETKSRYLAALMARDARIWRKRHNAHENAYVAPEPPEPKYAGHRAAHVYEYRGRKLTVAQWAVELGVTVPGMRQRLAYAGQPGWPPERVFGPRLRIGKAPPAKAGRATLHEYRGRKQTIAQWAAELGLAEDTIRTRLYAGWPPDRVFNSSRIIDRLATERAQALGERPAIRFRSAKGPKTGLELGHAIVDIFAALRPWCRVRARAFDHVHGVYTKAERRALAAERQHAADLAAFAECTEDEMPIPIRRRKRYIRS
jgi:hypothetical protein